MRAALEALLTVGLGETPALLGEIEELRATLLQRMLTPVREPDVLLTAEDVARRLACSQPFVYAHAEELGGVKLGDRAVRFKSSTVERFVKERAV